MQHGAVAWYPLANYCAKQGAKKEKSHGLLGHCDTHCIRSSLCVLLVSHKSAGKQWSRLVLFLPLSMCLPFVLLDKKIKVQRGGEGERQRERERMTRSSEEITQNKREEGERKY